MNVEFWMFKSCLNNVLRNYFKFLMKFLFFTLSTLLMSFNILLADELNVFDFTEKELSELQVRKVRGADNKTIYSVGSNENGNFLKSVADNAA